MENLELDPTFLILLVYSERTSRDVHKGRLSQISDNVSFFGGEENPCIKNNVTFPANILMICRMHVKMLERVLHVKVFQRVLHACVVNKHIGLENTMPQHTN